MKLAILGAGGKMGCRIVDHLKDDPAYDLAPVEVGEAGAAQLAERGLAPADPAQAIPDADALIIAVPDRLIGRVAADAVPRLKPGALVILLDPAAAHAGQLPRREDVHYFVTHPCHPSVFDHFETQEERDDFFGGVHARQAIVCALMSGPEEAYTLGEKIARDIWAPVTRAHRITVEQMAILEPAMSETCGIALIMLLREFMEEAISRGVPRAAAEDFMFGHIKVPLGIAFGRAPFPISDGAKLMAEYGTSKIINPEWRSLFDPEEVKRQVKAIVDHKMPEG
ncbi:phosphogluconate dehydrogenase C-terminal domain-containing protein [soil metagenome]